MLDAAATGVADQAWGLRQLVRPPALRVLPVAGGANGEERSQALAQLAVALAHTGAAVLILDQSKGEAGRALGIQPRYELLHLLEGEKTFAEVARRTQAGLRYVSASRGLAALAEAGTQGHALFGAFASLQEPIEFILLNLESPELAGRILPGTDGEVLLVVSPSSGSLTGAYTHIKRMSRTSGLTRYRILVVEADDPFEGDAVLKHIADVAHRFLGVRVQSAGIISRDPRWRTAHAPDGALALCNPSAEAARALQRTAAAIAAWRLIEIPFFDRTLRSPA